MYDCVYTPPWESLENSVEHWMITWLNRNLKKKKKKDLLVITDWVTQVKEEIEQTEVFNKIDPPQKLTLMGISKIFLN